MTVIYNPQSIPLIKERIQQAEELLNKIPSRYCFISGSFLYKDHYADVDIFVITRSKKKITLNHPKVKITILDFNDLYSLFYHSISKSCIAKNILPIKPLKVTMTDYWQVINESIPTLLNQKDTYHKSVRFLILYTEYFKSKEILDSFQLSKKIEEFKNYQAILDYVTTEIPSTVIRKVKPSYLKRFFYTQAGFYKEVLEYKAQKFLYDLTQRIIQGLTYG